jgi:hypothetical protein
MQMKQLLTAGVLAMSSTLALAGRVNVIPVSVTLNADGSGGASGNMASARAAANEVEYIGCGVRATADSSGGASVYAFCQANDAAGTLGHCSTENRELIHVVQHAADYSFITFRWNAAGQCQFIGISTQSFYIP